MDFQDYSHPARTVKAGRAIVEIPAGQRLTIETSPGGTEILDLEVPAGKQWTVHLGVDITETSA